jgi:hypothetical protein
MSNPTLRLAIERLVNASWEEASKKKPKWNGLAARTIAQLPENQQREIFAADLFLLVAARKIWSGCRGGLPN